VPLSFRLGESDGCYDHPEECTEVGNRFLVLVTEGALEPGHSHNSSTEAHIRGPHVLPEVSIKNLAPSQLRDRGCLPAILLTYQGALPCCGCGVPFSSRMTGHICGCICSLVIHHHDGAVQKPLTCIMQMDCDWRNDYLRSMIDRFSLGIGQSYQVSEAILRPIERPAHPTPFYLQL